MNIPENSEIKNNPDNEIKENKTFKRKRRLVVMGATLLLIGIVLALYYFIHSNMYQSTDDAFIEGHVIQISPKISGNIIKVNIRDNQLVKKGTLLAEIDPKDYLAGVEQARGDLLAEIARHKGANANVTLTDITSIANIEQASAGIEFYRYSARAAQAQIPIVQSRIAESQAQLAAEAANLRLTQQDLYRTQRLYQVGAVSRQELDVASANYNTARARTTAASQNVRVNRYTLSQAQAQLSEANANIKQAAARLKQVNTLPENMTISKSQLESSSAEIKRLKAALVQAELNLSYTKIYAPQAGHVARRVVEKGIYVQPGQALMAIVPNNTWVIANFKETQLTNMKPGQSVSIRVDTYPFKKFEGHVDSIQRGTGARFSLLPPENAVGSYVKVVQRVPVKIVFNDRPEDCYMFVPGMSVVPEVKVK